MPGFVPYDLAFNSTPTADIVRRSDGGPTELVFKVPGGDVRARRAAPAPSRPACWHP